jgi:hypothetical protein
MLDTLRIWDIDNRLVVSMDCWCLCMMVPCYEGGVVYAHTPIIKFVYVEGEKVFSVR